MADQDTEIREVPALYYTGGEGPRHVNVGGELLSFEIDGSWHTLREAYDLGWHVIGLTIPGPRQAPGPVRHGTARLVRPAFERASSEVTTEQS